MQVVKLRAGLVVLAGCQLLASGCLLRRGGNLEGSGSTISATMEGLEAGDEQRLKNIKYKLVCNSKFEAVGKINAQGVVEFNDQGLPANDDCALEVHADKEGNDTYKYVWLSRPPVEGLFYSSDLAKVRTIQDKSGNLVNVLAFKLFKVYGVEYTDSFAVSIGVKFELENGAQMPLDTEMVANLRCSDKKSYPSSAVLASADKERKFSFALSASLMKGVSCNEITVAKNNFAIFQGALTGVKFDAPVKGVPVAFAGPFTVRSTEEIIGGVVCTGKNEKDKCNSIRFPRPDKNMWFAIINTVTEANSAEPGVSYLLIDRSLGFNTDGNVLSIGSLQQDTTNMQKYDFYKIGAEAIILATEFNVTAIETALVAQRLTLEERGELTLRHFERVQLHGFKTVPESLVNAKTSARWLVQLQATNGSAKENFFVSGVDKYFSSTRGAAAKFFDLDALRADASKYTLYSYVGGAAKPEKCDLAWNYYLDAMSGKTVADLNGTTALPLIDACQVTGKDALQSLKGSWSYKPTFFLWDWHNHPF